MRYALIHADGRERIIEDGKIDKSTSLEIYGNGFTGYTDAYNKNIENLLTHYAGEESPRNPIDGQLWYNSKTKRLNIFDKDWHELTMPVDVSNYVLKSDSSMVGILKLNEDIEPSLESPVTRKYVDTKKFKFKVEKKGEISYVQYDNDYVYMNLRLDMSNKMDDYILLPYQMKDDNYSISLSTSSTMSTIVDTAVTIYNKSVNGFGVIIDKMVESIDIIIMGYITEMVAS